MEAIIAIVLLLVLMMVGVPIAFALGFSAIISVLFITGPEIISKVGWAPFHLLFNLSWTPLPLFILIGALIAETDIGKDLFSAATKWLSRVPGGLFASSIIGEGITAASLGTSAACIMVVGKIALPEFERNGYNRSLGAGSLLAGGLLGPLIPPSATMIIYAVLTETSLGHLFIAGVLPGILLVTMLSAVAIGICIRRPQYGPALGSYTWKERFSSLNNIWPAALIILSILGVIYFGIATPTESAGIGTVVVLILAITRFRLRGKNISNAMKEAATINSMFLFILIGASLFTYVVETANTGKLLFSFLQTADISPWVVIIAMNIIYLVLGIFLDPITITFITIPLFFPVIVQLGFDPIWFGIVFVVNTQLGLITPPMALDLIAMKTVFDIPIGELVRGVMPFFITELIFLAILIAFPQISLFLPHMMTN